MGFKNLDCYFRSMPEDGKRKALIQLTNRCNMKCKHCFVHAETKGIDIGITLFETKIIDTLKDMNVERVTLTGGEPLLYKDLTKVTQLILKNNMKVTLCTNGLTLNEELIKSYSLLGNVKVNISLDGIEKEGYENFRGVENSFEIVRRNIKLLSKHKLLKGILVTPNIYTSVESYIKLVLEMQKEGAEFILFNPLAEMGRGKEGVKKYGVSEEFLISLEEKIKNLKLSLEVIFIKFPSKSTEILSKKKECFKNKIMYIYADGKIVNCPYLDFIGKGEIIGKEFKCDLSSNRIEIEELSCEV